MKLRSALLAITLLASTPSVFAQEPPQTQTELSEADIKARAEAIQKTLRCVVCQNQSIADSNSTLAEDMRNLVEHRVRLGESEQEVRDYMQARYGDFVLMKPPLKLYTLLLWFGPALLILFGIWYFISLRKSGENATAEDDSELSESERARLSDLMNRPGEQ